MSAVPEQDTAAFDREARAIELRRRTSAARSRNRPTWMPVVAAGVLVTSAAWAWASVASASSAERLFRSRTRDAQDIQALLERYNVLLEEVEAEVPAVTGGRGPVSLIDEAAKRVGLESIPVPNRRPVRLSPGTVRMIYPYRDVQSREIAPLLRWVGEVLGEAPWLDLHGIRVQNMGPVGWKMTVEFAMLEAEP